MSLPKISSLILLLASAVLIVVSLATDFWISGPAIHFGLWRVCYFNSAGCLTIASAADIDSIRAFIIISFLLLLVAVALQIKENWTSGPSMSVNVQKLTAIIAFCAGVSAIIAMSIFTGSASSPGLGVQYSWSYGLGWASAALSVVAAIVAYFSFKQEV